MKSSKLNNRLRIPIKHKGRIRIKTRYVLVIVPILLLLCFLLGLWGWAVLIFMAILYREVTYGKKNRAAKQTYSESGLAQRLIDQVPDENAAQKIINEA